MEERQEETIELQEASDEVYDAGSDVGTDESATETTGNASNSKSPLNVSDLVFGEFMREVRGVGTLYLSALAAVIVVIILILCRRGNAFLILGLMMAAAVLHALSERKK